MMRALLHGMRWKPHPQQIEAMPLRPYLIARIAKISAERKRLTTNYAQKYPYDLKVA